MALVQSGELVGSGLFLHPCVGIVADPRHLTPRQREAAIAKVAYLEHALFDGDQVERSLDGESADALVGEINELRRALGWLEVDLDGRWRWPPQPA